MSLPFFGGASVGLYQPVGETMENGIPQPSAAADADVGTSNPTDQQVDKEAMQRRVEIKKQQALALRNKKKRERERARELAEEAADLAEAEAGAEPPSMDGPEPPADAEAAPTSKRARTATQAGWKRDTRAGFFMPEEDEADTAKPPPTAVYEDAPESAPNYPAHVRCTDCNGEFFNSKLQKEFGLMVCDACRDKYHDEKYTVVTKMVCKEDYLLKDADLGGRPDSLRYIERKNKKNEKWNPYKLYLLCQVEERSYKLYGGEEGLDAEFDRREELKKAKTIAKTKKQFKETRKKTLTAQWFAREGSRAEVPHEHTYGEETYDADADEYNRACTSCGHVRTYEKM